MATSSVNGLPAGFVLDPVAQSNSSLPTGFVLDANPPSLFSQALNAGVQQVGNVLNTQSNLIGNPVQSAMQASNVQDNQPTPALQSVGQNMTQGTSDVAQQANKVLYPSVGRPMEELARVGQAEVPYVGQAKQWAKSKVPGQGFFSDVARSIIELAIPTTNADFATLAILPEEEAVGIGSIALEKAIPDAYKAILTDAVARNTARSALRSQSLAQEGQKLAQEATDIQRSVLRPGYRNIQSVEVKNGKSIDELASLAAKDKIEINKTSQNTYDTLKSQEQVTDNLVENHKQLNTLLENRPEVFDINDIRRGPNGNIGDKRSLLSQALKKQYSNATEYKQALEQANEFIDNEIADRGSSKFSAVDYNNVKTGMWQVGYNQMKPTASAIARTVGHLMKDDIENTIADPAIKALSQKTGQYSDLNYLLRDLHGRTIPNKSNKLIAKVVGGIIGQSTGLPIIGPYIGSEVSGAIADRMSNPEYLSRMAGEKMTKAQKYIEESGVNATQNRSVEALRLHNKTQLDLLNKAGIDTKEKVTAYLTGSAESGRKMSEYVRKVLSGELTEQDAVRYIKKDYKLVDYLNKDKD